MAVSPWSLSAPRPSAPCSFTTHRSEVKWEDSWHLQAAAAFFWLRVFVTEDSWVIEGWSQGLSCSRRRASSGFAFEEPSAQALKDCSTDACPKASTGHSFIPLTPSGFHPLLSIPGFGSKEMWEDVGWSISAPRMTLGCAET